MYKAYRSTIERRNQLRWQKIVRLDGLPIEQIAKQLGYTYDQVRRTLESPYYQEWRKAKLEGGVSAFDHILAEDAEEMKLSLRELVPAAIRKLECALRSTDESIALRAAEAILDRDERFNKTAQMAVAHTFIIPEHDLERARAIARELKPIDVEASPLAVTPSLPGTETD
jgi:hypothetical protein